MKAYLDNNIFIDIEDNSLTIEDLIKNVDSNLQVFYYSASHLQEANEIKGETQEIIIERLLNRFHTISKVTNDNYLYLDLHSNDLLKIKEKPSIVYETINQVPFAQNTMKSMANLANEEQKEAFRNLLDIDMLRINNYNPVEVIEHINSKSELMGGFTLVELIENAIGFHPQGKDFGLHNRIAGIFELLDMIGYWKDKFNEKSNYARLWDSSHTYFSSSCDYFISNDKRTRNKAKVVFEIYGIKTKVVSSKGLD
ncbi:hypothetical protein [Flavobacterium sp. CLA17]|uniref:hypothetical protein n=1 Tax=Flavobacterium sp. CLA17 TaxID=2724135 RepID=UPI001492FAFB|nr:hypothetical protein [Flavobacterium sp. CLA17]QSB25466.1 hypothetical protein HAV12_013905 [Flavobacterium sp. CLA17]